MTSFDAMAPGRTAAIDVLGLPIEADRYPHLHRFLRFDAPTPAEFFPPFAALLRSGEVSDMLLHLLGHLVSDEKQVLRQGSQASSLTLWRDASKIVSLAVWSFDDESASEGAGGALLSNRYPLLLAPLGAEPLAYRRYSFEAPNGLSVFEPGIRLVPQEQAQIAGGEGLLCANPCEVFDFAASPGSYLTLSVAVLRFEAPLVWLFDRATLNAVRAVSANDAASRSELLLQVFERLKFMDGRAMIEEMLESPHHFLRWRAVQSMLKLYGAGGMKALQKAADDPHPHVRRAAQRTLASVAAQTSSQEARAW